MIHRRETEEIVEPTMLVARMALADTSSHGVIA